MVEIPEIKLKIPNFFLLDWYDTKTWPPGLHLQTNEKRFFWNTLTVGWEFLNEYFAFNIVGVELVLWQYYSHDNKHLTLPNHADQTNQTKQDSV